MPAISKSLIEVTKEQKHAIRKDVNLDSEEKLRECINEIVEWYKEQSHLPRIDLDRIIVERLLIARKGSVAQTKEKIDSLFTAKTLYPELASPRDVDHEQIQRSFQSIITAPLRKLNYDNTRVTIGCYTGDNTNYNVTDQTVYIFMVMEYRLKYDYTAGDRFIFDLKEKNWRHYSTELRAASLLPKIDKYVKSAFGQRVKGIHLINAPTYIQKMLAMFKVFLPKKIMDRIIVHPTYEDLYTVIDKDILPNEYGGKEKLLQEIMGDWNRELRKENVKKYLLYQETLKSDESKRKK